MNAVYVITAYAAKKAGFLIEDQTLTEASFFDDSSILGNIYSAVVEKIVPSIGAAFVDCGLTEPLYLPIEKAEEHYNFIRHGNSAVLKTGDVILVQVCREAIKTKRATVTSNLNLTGEYCVLNLSGEIGISKSITDTEKKKELRAIAEELLQRENKTDRNITPGLVIRTAAKHCSKEALCDEITELLHRMNRILEVGLHSAPKCLIDSNRIGPSEKAHMLAEKKMYSKLDLVTDDYLIFEEMKAISLPKETNVSFFDSEKSGDILSVYNIRRDMERALGKKVYLKSGGSLVIEVTEALTVIDVNSGKSIDGKNQEKNLFKTNMEAIDEIAVQLRLRNLSGMILIDFINLKEDEHNAEMLKKLKAVIAKDPVKTNFVDITGLGLCELTRKKENKPLHERIL